MDDEAPVTMKRLQAGGAVRAGALYVERAADSELVEALLRGEPCHVLATSQAGKSSLKLHAARRLEAAGVRCARVEPSREASAEAWYHGLARDIARAAEIEVDVDAFWARETRLPAVDRWAALVESELLPRAQGKLVVFLDELPAVLGLAFSTEPFFAKLREMNEARAARGRSRGVTFCLLGTAYAGALSGDVAQTPLHGSREITLDDFTRDEVDAFGAGLRATETEEETRALLDEVFTWAHGHPYMTAKLCEALAGRSGKAEAKELVAQAAWQTFLNPERERDASLSFAQSYLLRRGVPADEVVTLYRRLLEGEQVPYNPRSEAEQHLRLSGLAAARRREGESGRWLEVRNRVVAEALGIDWVTEDWNRARQQADQSRAR